MRRPRASTTTRARQLLDNLVFVCRFRNRFHLCFREPATRRFRKPLAIAGYALIWILQTLGVLGTATGDTATTTGTVLTLLVAAFGALGVTAKFDRAFAALSTIAGLMHKVATLVPPAAAPTGGK